MLRTKFIAIIVVTIGIVVLALGGTFIGISVAKNNYIASSLRAQQVTLGLTKDQIAAGQFVDNAQEAQVAAETLAKHLSSIAPTYGALTAQNPGGKFDPTNPTDATYAQGLNLENSMNMTVLGFGLVQQTLAIGLGLVVIGLAMGGIGTMLFRYECTIPKPGKTKSGA